MYTRRSLRPISYLNPFVSERVTNSSQNCINGIVALIFSNHSTSVLSSTQKPLCARGTSNTTISSEWLIIEEKKLPFSITEKKESIDFSWLPNSLQSLEIKNHKLASLKDIAVLQGLKVSSEVTEKGMAFLRSLPSLSELTLVQQNITDEGWKQLEAFPSLKNLDIRNCNITDETLRHVSEIKTLRSLSLINCKNITLEGIEIFLNHFRNSSLSDDYPALVLKVESCPNIDAEKFRSFIIDELGLWFTVEQADDGRVFISRWVD